MKGRVLRLAAVKESPVVPTENTDTLSWQCRTDRLAQTTGSLGIQERGPSGVWFLMWPLLGL